MPSHTYIRISAITTVLLPNQKAALVDGCIMEHAGRLSSAYPQLSFYLPLRIATPAVKVRVP
jgi:hypothetical protein